MTSLADLLNPTFLVFLGILVLVVAFLILYFESKLREQNHKIASMLSLVSTLAEDMNGVKIGLNHLSIRGGQGFEQPIVPIQENLGNLQKNNLIDVSDDDEEDEDDDEEDDDDEASESQGSNDVINDDLDSIEKDLDSVDLDSVEDDLDSIEDDLDSIEDDLDSENGENIKIVTLQVSNENIDETNEEIHNLDFDNEYSADLDDEFEPEVNNET